MRAKRLQSTDIFHDRVLARFAAAALIVCGAPGRLVPSADAQQRTKGISDPPRTTVLSITLTKNTDLDFAELVASGTSGSVIVSPAGARSATGGVTLGNPTGATGAVFTVGGDPLATYSITLPSSATLTSGSNNMTVDNFTSNPIGTGTLSSGGSQTLNVGASLQVGANQPAGTYSGSFDVTVTYN